MNAALANLAYLVASILFIVGLKMMSHPRTAVRGNQFGALGMLIAIVVTLLVKEMLGAGWEGYALVAAGLLVGSAAGALLAVKTPMTGMPQMVALLNGFGGIASLLVAGAALIEERAQLVGPGSPMEALQLVASGTVPMDAARYYEFTISTAAAGFIGSITFWGSLLAFLKLQEWMPSRAILLPARHLLHIVLAVAVVGLSVWIVIHPDQEWAYWVLCVVSSVLGVCLALPIGGADMPVVISLLNSYSGLAGAATGFVLENNVLIIAGSLVGASGIILTRIMCKAMNRSLTNVLFGVLDASTAAKADDVYGGKVKSTSPEELAMMLDGVRRVVIVPGYGMAVAQAQHAVRDMANLLESRGAEVLYAIHPVAGRMPGHMNVLLAEADVPYDKMKEMDEINPTFAETDVVFVIGANDTVNPSARTDPKSPIAGMPILDVDKARTVVVVKRSLSPGFAGIPNPLFVMENTLMFFADAKKGILSVITALKEG